MALAYSRAELCGPEMAAPPLWRCLVPGLVCIAGGWALLWLHAPSGAVIQWGWHFVVLVAGLVALLTGVSVLCWPWTGRGLLCYRLPEEPEPLVPGIAAPSMRGPLLDQIGRWKQWVEALLSPPRGHLVSDHIDWPRPRPIGTILDALVSDWDKHVADLFRQHIQETKGKKVAQLAENPDVWAECLVGDPVDLAVGLEEPAFLFALQIVSAWLNQSGQSCGLPVDVKPDPQWFESFMTRACAVRWPTTRVQPRADASVIAVGKSLWHIVEPLAKANPRHLLLKVDWQDPQMLVIIRVVQGLKGGWREFPALPEKPPQEPDEDETSDDQQP